MARANVGNKYILVFLDVFTKMCCVEPMKDKQVFLKWNAFKRGLLLKTGDEKKSHFKWFIFQRHLKRLFFLFVLNQWFQKSGYKRILINFISFERKCRLELMR